MRQLFQLFALALLGGGMLTAGQPTARMNVKTERDEPGGWRYWYSPKRPPQARTREGIFKSRRVNYVCYPIVTQTVKRDKKALLLRIFIFGPRGWDMRKAIIVSVDGKSEQISLAGDEIRPHGMGFIQAVEITLARQEGLISRIAKARDVSLALPEPVGDGKLTLQLSDRQIELIREVLEFYADLEPRD